MCGIYGCVGADVPADVAARNRLQHHRGPDGSGEWRAPDGRAALGHTRLAILDLSASAAQPMRSPCGRYAIVYNGEVYNFRELRAELEACGATFRGTGDTEVVLAAYARWGRDCVRKFNGMFAFAVLDRGDGTAGPRVFLARDRAGKKPLYYRRAVGSLEFASELKTLADLRRADARLDLRALNFYLALGYVPAASCILEGVRKLPPAHAALYDVERDALEVWRYWSLPDPGAVPRHADPRALVEELEALLVDAVRVRLVSDVPLGVLLSGGTDSSLVLAAAARSSEIPVRTFTIGFPGAGRFDETEQAARVAARCGAVHHLLPGREAWPALLGTLEALVDEPIADSSILPTLLVSELARVHVTVALGGDGGDELFGGYGRYPAARRVADLCGWAPSAVWPALAALAGPLPTGLRGRQLGCSLRSGPRRMLARYTPYFDPAARARLLSPDARAALGASLDEPERWRLGILGDAADVVAAASRLDFLSYLPDDILAKVDRASMFHSLEVRAPWLDVRVIEFAFGRVPTRWKVDRGRTRLLERLLAERMLPGLGVGTRKQGFSIPFGAWPDRRQAREVAERTEPLREFLDPAEVARLALVPPLRSANANRLFAVLVLCLALRRLGVGR